MTHLSITRFTFGTWGSLCRTKTGAVAYSDTSKYWLVSLDDTRVEVPSDQIVRDTPAEPRPSFERANFGGCERFAWDGGACAIPLDAELSWWGGRFVAWTTGSVLSILDLERATITGLVLPLGPLALDPRQPILASETTLHLKTLRTLVLIDRAELEALGQGASGAVEVHVREVYPTRRADAKLTMQVTYSWGDELRLQHPHGGWSSLVIPWVPGLDRGDLVTLHNRLAVDLYLEYSIGDGPRLPLYQQTFPDEHTSLCSLTVEPAIDPAAAMVRASPAARVEDLDRMFGLLADEPSDEAAPMVVVDLLEDAGEPYAPAFGRLLAGELAARAEALGILSTYLDDIEWRGALPRAATLAATAPLDDDINAVVLADHRLGFFHTLRLGEGNFKLYAKLVSSPRAIGLRACDGSRLQTLKALIAAGRSTLTRLTNLKFVSREVIEALADPTFDRVVELETEVQAGVADRLLDYIARDEAKLFARAPRHLTLVERAGNIEALVAPVVAAWPRLPLHRLTIGSVTLDRDGVAIIRSGTSKAMRAVIASRFRVEEC